MAARVGQQLGHYRLLRLLGQGAFAEVYLGEHLYLERPAAIKVLHVQMEPETQEQFRREARTIANLQHPHIVSVHDFGLDDQTPYLVMEYTPGGTLHSQHPKGTRLPFEQLVSYVKQIASALDYAHEQRVIHRDVKPANLLLNARGEVVLSDFGLAVVQRTLESLSTQEPAGTPLYMAPEQIRHHPCAASDQYALGIMVYQWLCGEPPFGGQLYAVLAQHLSEHPPSLCQRLPDLPVAVEEAVFKALAKDPAQRFACVADFTCALEHACSARQPLTLQELPEQQTHEQTVSQNTSLVSASPAREQTDGSFSTEPQPLTMPRPGRGHEGGALLAPGPVPPPQSVSKEVKPSLAQSNRQRFLRRVRTFWIEGVLSHSLHGAALIALGLQEQRDTLANPWHLVLQHPDTAPRAFPAGTRVTEVYDAANGELLILGTPGSGKTTLLLELARDLLDRAEQDEQHLMPVVFHLSSWTGKQRLTEWMVEELISKYQVPRKLARTWVDAEQILPLLDGLDEVAPESRTACIATINTYREEHGLLPLVVASRSADYLEQTGRLRLSSAVTIQALTQKQVEDYLASGGESLRALRVAFQQDASLRELTETPLMLSILTLTYHDLPVEKLLQGGIAPTRQQVFETYVKRMLTRRDGNVRYRPEQTMSWLAWLAQKLVQHSQTEFYLERMQPGWLAKSWGRRLYSCSSGGLLGALFTALVGGVVSGLLGLQTFSLLTSLVGEPFLDLVFAWIDQLFGRGSPMLVHTYQGAISGLVTGLAYGLLVGLVGGLLVGLFNTREPEIKPVEVVIWSWVTLPRDVIASLVTGLLCVFLLGLSGSPVGVFLSSNGQPVTVGVTRFSSSHSTTSLLLLLLLFLLSVLQQGLKQGLIFGLVGGLVSSLLSGKLRPHYPKIAQQGKWASMRIGVIVGLVDWLVGLPLAQSVSILLDKPLGGLLHWSLDEPTKPLGILAGGLIGAVLCMLVGGLTFGLINGFSSRQLEKRLLVLPNQGIRRSAQISLRVGLLAGLTYTLLFSPLMWLSEGSIASALVGESLPYGELLTYGLFTGLVFAPFVGLLVGLFYGGTACIKHVILRLFLWRMRCIPWHYSRFLDYAAERILLRKVGGGYIFVHRLLLEYFASLDTPPTPNAARAKKEQV